MSQYPKSYNNLTDPEKLSLISKLYTEENKSFADIASLLETYPNKIRRDAISLGIPIRNKSEAQKNALSSGKHKHPTKGHSRDNETKSKIGLGVMKSWENLTTQELEERKEKSKEQWDSLDQNAKQNLIKKANDAVRVASKLGSKLEKFILNKLISDGYKVDFHKEQTLSNTKLQIDLFLPKINTAIEIDGPSHFLPVWGDDALTRNKRYDNKKQGLILGKGYVLIRIKQTKDFSNTRALLIYNELVKILQSIESNFPEPDDRNYTIEDTNG